ncbi:MAG: Wzt carbohydrate-binding domain-containing protein, partial [Undibacterium sp.]|nr:Wzt carbohydrate-binding domain-containing protein [Undibacterium sp.]
FECTLGPGSYSITTALTRDETHLAENFEWSDNLLVFDVVNLDRTVFVGSQWLKTEFRLQREKTT